MPLRGRKKKIGHKKAAAVGLAVSAYGRSFYAPFTDTKIMDWGVVSRVDLVSRLKKTVAVPV